MIEINPLSNKPIYLQIVDNLKQNLATGELTPGEQLPTVRQLADQLNINFNTIARAYRILDEEGIITTQHGRGTFIRTASEQLSKEELLSQLTQDYLTQARALGYNQKQIQNSIENFFLINHEPPQNESKTE